MRVAVPNESQGGERRVALVPDVIKRLVAKGHEVVVESGAGERARIPDVLFEEAGARIASGGAVLEGASAVVRVTPPSSEEIDQLPDGSVLIAFLAPLTSPDTTRALASAGVTAFAMEAIPRITRAQSMDALSSQATVSGYRATLIAAQELGRFLPMLTTAAGTIPPAKVLVLGAGVAGLQAIATARRLGAVVSAFDIRAAVREQVQSLGATFVAADVASQSAEDRGGYARQQTQDEAQRTLAAIARHIKDQDLVISTALVPGKPAPRLITEEMVQSMQPGSVIVDLAAEAGGNCALTRPGETVRAHGVTIIGAVNLPSTVPLHASQMISKNIFTLLHHLMEDGKLNVDPNDEIVKPMMVVPGGSIRA